MVSDSVELWRAPLEPPAPVLQLLSCSLSHVEVARASRFRRPSDRRKFVAAHGFLRHLLSGYTGMHPRELRLAEGPAGKPHLASDVGEDVRFNLAHSGDLALFAVARGRDVGVDIERIDPAVDWASLAPKFFSPWERSTVAGLRRDERMRAYFEIWTRKEALVKATGSGLGVDLTALHATPGEWTVRGVEVDDGYAAAVAVSGRHAEIAPVRDVSLA